MPEQLNDKTIFSLFEISLSIQRAISASYNQAFWIKAEMNKLNYYSHSGHCYPELVEKKDGKVIAQMRGNLWNSDFIKINHKFLRVLKEPLKDGIKILFCATINFDPVYGLGLRILDIDPSFSLGELEREKQETIERLREENIFDKNKALKLPLLPQRIAIISVETSKGYSDFLKVIDTNSWNYKFFHHLFPALLQGDKSIDSIIFQLKRIRKSLSHFDAVVIIRGGGGDVGLSSYNNYRLAKEIALFPIPILTGIGHSTNETVAEMVCYDSCITPTELADFLIEKFHAFSEPVEKAEALVKDKASRIIQETRSRFDNTLKYFRSVTTNRLERSHNEIRAHSVTLSRQSNYILRNEKQALSTLCSDLQKSSTIFINANRQTTIRLASGIEKLTTSSLEKQKAELVSIEKHVRILDPVNVLRRGYSITLLHGKSVNSVNEVKPGDQLTTVVADGTISSNVIKTNENNG
jgi:exodeoxyribonuclease VII large subunit